MKIIKTNANFKKIKLNEIINIKNGFAFKNPNLKEGVKWLTIKNIQNGYIDWGNTSYLPIRFLQEYSDFVLYENDLVLALTRPITNDLLKVSRVDSFSNKSLLNQRNAKITSKYNCNNDFLYYLFLSKKMKEEIDKAVQGSDPPNISSKQIELFEFNIPEDIKYQNKIADVLTIQENQVNNIKTLISKLEKRNQYYAERLLSGELRVREDDDGKVAFYENEDWKEIEFNGKLKNIPSNWSIDKINLIIPLTKGSSVKSSDFNHEGKGEQYLRTNEIWDNSSKNKDPVFFDGDLENMITKNNNDYIVCFDGYNNKPLQGTLGMVTNNGIGICSGELHKIGNIEKLSKYYVNVMLLKNHRFQEIICRYAEGSSVQHAGKHFKKIDEVLIPFEEQKLLNNIFKIQLKEIEKLKILKNKEQKRFEWMSEALLSGEYQIIE
jgi:hypothetical protein